MGPAAKRFGMRRGKQIRGLWRPLAAIAVLFGTVALLQARIDARARSVAREKEELLVTSGPVLKKLSLGYAPLLADIYWTRVVQYYGTRVGIPGANFDLLGPLLAITTTLDPHLVVAYRFGGIFLSEPGPIGEGRTDLAVHLVKRGIAANPNVWQLYYDLGFLYYWRLKDYKHAAATYLAGGKVPGAPVIMRLMAARVAEKGGSTETSEMIFSALYHSTKDERVRKLAVTQLRILRAQQDESQLDQLIDAYRERLHKNPTSTRDLITAGLLGGVPIDPAGYPFIIGADGKARLDPRSPIATHKR